MTAQELNDHYMGRRFRSNDTVPNYQLRGQTGVIVKGSNYPNYVNFRLDSWPSIYEPMTTLMEPRWLDLIDEPKKVDPLPLPG